MKSLFTSLLLLIFSTAVFGAGWSLDDPLMPTGDSTQDTENLQAALHDTGLDSGGTLYLGPGTFRIHGTVGRQDVSDPSLPSYSTILFNGTIQGAGKGVTIIKGVRKPDDSQFEPLVYFMEGFGSDDHTLIALVQTYLGVKDLTFDSEPGLVDFVNEYDGNGEVIGTFPGNLYGTHGLVNYLGTGTFVRGLNELIGTDIANVHFRGSLGSDGNPETPHLFQHWGDAGGVHNVTNSEFENSGYGAFQLFDLENATINVGGNPKDRVQITNALRGGLQVAGCTNVDLNVSHLKTRDAGGVYFWPGRGNTEATLVVTHSDIRLRPGSNYAGVELWGRSGELSITIEKNKFHSEDTFLWGPIYSDGAMQNGLIANNKFTGRGPAAMYLEVNYWHAGTVTIHGNSLDNWVTTPDPWGLGTAPIWLGPFVVNSVVVGEDIEANVFDEPAYDTSWNPLYDEDGNPLTIPGYGDLIPPGQFGSLVPKNNSLTGPLSPQ